MSKLSQTDFGTLLTLASRTDLEQRADLERFLKTAPETQSLILKLAQQTVVARSIKNGQYLEDEKPKDTNTQVSKDGVTPKNGKKPRGIRKKKPLEIYVPNGCSFNETIPFSIEHFDKWLGEKGLKSTKTYSGGMKTLLKNAGFAEMNHITLLALRTIRDSISGPGKNDTNKRLWLKKFNHYIAYEYEKKCGNV